MCHIDKWLTNCGCTFATHLFPCFLLRERFRRRCFVMTTLYHDVDTLCERHRKGVWELMYDAFVPLSQSPSPSVSVSASTPASTKVSMTPQSLSPLLPNKDQEQEVKIEAVVGLMSDTRKQWKRKFQEDEDEADSEQPPFKRLKFNHETKDLVEGKPEPEIMIKKEEISEEDSDWEDYVRSIMQCPVEGGVKKEDLED